jgi:hypothetical protein
MDGGPASASTVNSDAGAGHRDVGSIDARVPTDAPLSIAEFADLLSGTWLIGWSGGQDHYSWLRLRGDSAAWSGVAQFLADDDLALNDPYWECSGQGRWMITERPNTIGVTLPDDCPDKKTVALTFYRFSDPPSSPKGVMLQASIEVASAPPNIEGFKFPDGQCDATMTSCANPF